MVLPVPPKDLEEAMAVGRGLTGNSWTWQGQDSEPASLLDEHVIPWLHEEILRAPTPRGIDVCVVYAGVGTPGKQTSLAVERWICDKWGWRKEGEETVRAWLLQQCEALGAAEGGLQVEVYSFSRMLVGQGEKPD
jgi:hypothetical protein